MRGITHTIIIIKNYIARKYIIIKGDFTMSRGTNVATGMRFGSLIVTKRLGYDKHRNIEWLCKCDCGQERIAKGYMLLANRTRKCSKCNPPVREINQYKAPRHEYINRGAFSGFSKYMADNPCYFQDVFKLPCNPGNIQKAAAGMGITG